MSCCGLEGGTSELEGTFGSGDREPADGAVLREASLTATDGYRNIDALVDGDAAEGELGELSERVRWNAFVRGRVGEVGEVGSCASDELLLTRVAVCDC